jgi:biopolymer transport protein ExbD
MRLSKRRRIGVLGVNLTPMIDVVFQLLIFFMTCTQVSQINREPVDLPKLPGSDDQEPSIVTVNVLENGSFVVSGNRVSLAQLTFLVQDQIRQLGGNPDRLTMVVRADQRANTTPVNQIVSAMAQLQLKRLRIAVEVSEP